MGSDGAPPLNESLWVFQYPWVSVQPVGQGTSTLTVYEAEPVSPVSLASFTTR